MGSSSPVSKVTIFTQRDREFSGFVLPVVVIAGLIIAAGIMAMTTRVYSGLMGSIRQGQSKQAQQAAETGLNTILKELNEKYPYLLISHCNVGKTYEPSIDCKGWIPEAQGGTLLLETSKCDATVLDTAPMLNKIKSDLDIDSVGNARSRYQLVSYNFQGDEQQGGEAVIRVKGEALAGSNQNRSTAVIEQTIPILPKNCNVPINAPTNDSTFAGLLTTGGIEMGGNDVTGDVNGNVYCFACDPSRDQNLLKEDIGGAGMKLSTDRKVFAGPINMPNVPTFPRDPSLYRPLKILNGTQIYAGQSNGGGCFTDSDGVTHCLVKCLKATGSSPTSQLKIWTAGSSIPSSANEGVRLYFPYSDAEVKTDPDCSTNGVFSMSGGSSLTQAGSTNPNPTNLSIFGSEKSGDSVTQTFELGGGSTASAFFFIPNAVFGINGGSGGEAGINELNGAVWSRCYSAGPMPAQHRAECGSGVGSASTGANIFVPPNMGRLLFEKFGIEFALGIREFVAVGSTRWQLYQVPSN